METELNMHGRQERVHTHTGMKRINFLLVGTPIQHNTPTTTSSPNFTIFSLHLTSFACIFDLSVVLLVHASPGKQKAVYHFLVSHLLSGPILHQPPPRTWNQRYVILVSGSLLSPEATEEVNLQLFPTGNCKEEVWRGRDATYEFSYTNITWVVETADNRC